MSHSSQQPSEPAYYIEDCWISGPASTWSFLDFMENKVASAVAAVAKAPLQFSKCLACLNYISNKLAHQIGKRLDFSNIDLTSPNVCSCKTFNQK